MTLLCFPDRIGINDEPKEKEKRMLYVLAGYLAVMNIAGFAVCAADKRAAVRHARRVRERTLFVLAFLGGALGVWLSMLAFHHKTRKLKFMVFVPVVFIAQAALVFYLLSRQ